MKFNKIYFKEYKDLFNYYNLIKTINSSYRLYFNEKDKKYYIININNNFEICGEFIHFSKINLNNLRFSSIINIDKIIKEIENHNELIEKNNINNILDKTKYSLNEVLNLSKRSSNINNYDLTQIIGAKQ